jgi:hypothetical protein
MADVTISQLTTTNALLATSYVPVSDGTTTTKLATDSLFGFRNRIINGDMRIDQRNGGTGVAWAANTAGYTVDRFKQTQNGTAASTIQQTTDVPAAQGFTSSLSRTITTAEPAVASGNKTCGYYYMLEGYNVSDFLWGTASAKPITISFWVKSSVTGTFSFSVMNTTFTRSYNSSYSISAANTWEKKTFTVPGDTGATSINKTNGNAIQLVFDLGFSSIYESSTANTWQGTASYALAGCVKLSSTLGATFYLTGLQLEDGPTATPFERRFIGNELTMCKRYYDKSYNIDVAPGTATRNGMVVINTEAWQNVWIPVGSAFKFSCEMRTTPVIAYYDGVGTINRVSVLWYGAAPVNGQNPTLDFDIGTSGVAVRQTGGTTYQGSIHLAHYTANAEL